MSDIGRSQFQTSLLVLGLAYKGDNAMSLGLILVIGLVIFLLGGFSDRFRGYGYGFGHGGIGVALIVVVVLMLLGRL
jgi:hypothetical protein